MAQKVGDAIATSCKKAYGGNEITFCEADTENDIFRIYIRKNVVDEIENDYTDILLADAKKYDKNAEVGGTVDIDLDTKKFGRIIAQSAKNVIHQGIREAEHGKVLEEFQSKNKDIVTAIIQRIDPKTGNATITINGSEAVLPKVEQVPDEVLNEGDHVKVYIVDVRSTEKGPKVMISRTHPGLVTRLFEAEVPEIFDGTIEIKSSLPSGRLKNKSSPCFQRTKASTPSALASVSAVCVLTKIVEELGGEKIDIVKYSEDPAAFISEALSPAKVVGVEILDEEQKSCRVTVPDSQLSLAIGNKGQNVRLAARLTGWKIDIRPESGFFGEGEEEEKQRERKRITSKPEFLISENNTKKRRERLIKCSRKKCRCECAPAAAKESQKKSLCAL